MTTETRRHGNYGRAAAKVGRAPGGGTTADGVHGLEPSLALWAAVLSQAQSDVRSAISYAKHGPPLSTRNGEEAAARHAVAWVFAPANPDRSFVLEVLGLCEDALHRELVRWHGRDLVHVQGGDAIGELDRRLKLSVPGGVASVEPRVRIVPSRWASTRLEQGPRRPRGRPRRDAVEPGSRRKHRGCSPSGTALPDTPPSSDSRLAVAPQGKHFPQSQGS